MPIARRVFTVTIDGRRYTMVRDPKTFALVEQAAGRPVPDVLADVKRGSLRALRVFWWSLLARSQPEITLQAAGDLLQRYLETHADVPREVSGWLH